MGVEKKSVTLTIRGRSYSLRTEADSQRLKQVEGLVNSRLDELEEQSGTKSGAGLSDVRLLMLALLNVADECLTHQQNFETVEERVETLNETLSLMLDEEMPEQIEQIELMAS